LAVEWEADEMSATFAAGEWYRGPGRPHVPALRLELYSSVRAAAGLAVAVMLFVLCLPVMLAAVVLTRLTSRGPAIYRQIRVGRDGREFSIYKIRSMYVDCERATGPRWATPGDPRVTPLGRFLRRTHADELPQLINVLRGEMSLIGPRPERPEFVGQLETAIPLYRHRERVLPGVTGLAQVRLPPDTEISEVRRKLACDLYYLESRNLWLDLRIVLGTAAKVIGVPTRVSCHLLRLPDSAEIEANYARLVSAAGGQGEPSTRWAGG
jgi:lipopolysaccharide/colanic/teichoic acid biosynthesis glycosyltransferase